MFHTISSSMKTPNKVSNLKKNNNLNFLELWYDEFKHLDKIKDKIETFRK